MTLRTTEFGGEKCLNQFPGECMPHNEATKTHHVQIIILDTLMGRKGFMDQAGTNPNDFVCGHGCPDATSANANPALHIAAGNGAGKRNNKIRIIIVFFRLTITEIDHLVSTCTQLTGQIFL